jgi:hypothetical protein
VKLCDSKRKLLQAKSERKQSKKQTPKTKTAQASKQAELEPP